MLVPRLWGFVYALSRVVGLFVRLVGWSFLVLWFFGFSLFSGPLLWGRCFGFFVWFLLGLLFFVVLVPWGLSSLVVLPLVFWFPLCSFLCVLALGCGVLIVV